MALLELNEARRWAKKWFKVPSVVHISNILISVHQQNFQNVSRMVARFTHNASVSGFFSVQNVETRVFVPHDKQNLSFLKNNWKCSSVGAIREKALPTQNRDSTKLFSTSTRSSSPSRYWVAAQSTHRTVPARAYRTHLFLLELTTTVPQRYSTKTTQYKTNSTFLSTQFRCYTMKLWL